VQGKYLAHLTQLTSLRMRVNSAPTSGHDDFAVPERTHLRLHAYPTSLRELSCAFDDGFDVFVKTYPRASSDMVTGFYAAAGIQPMPAGMQWGF